MKNFKLISIYIFAITFLVSGLSLNTKIASAGGPTLSSGDFVVWNQGGLVGYDAGYSLSGSTFNEATSIVIKLYSGNTLLQTNTAIPGKITGTQFLTPFDVFGSFNYANDGYFINVRESEYGQNLPATKAIAIVTLTDGKILIATSFNLAGDTSLIFKNSTPGQVLGSEKFHFTQKLKVASSGNEVMELQKLLNMSGYSCGIPDGKFGPKTKSAVIKFQIANGLKGDGIVGSMTHAILNK